MKKLLVLLITLGLCGISLADESHEDVKQRLNTATDVMQATMNAGDKGVPEEVLGGAKCVAVVPHLIKGAFIFGGERGHGIVTCRTINGWSAPAFFSITGGSWGAQIGAESTDLVMMFMTNEGAKRLMENKFKIGGDVSAAAGPVGRHASANTDWKLDTQILTYSRNHGAFIGISLNGSWLQQDKDETRALYGHNVDYKALLDGEVPIPREAQAFIREIRQAKTEAENK